MRSLRGGRGLLALVAFLGGSTAGLAHPGAAIGVGRDGRVFFVDTGGGVFQIGRDGRVTRHEGPAFHWLAIDHASRLAKTPWPAIPNSEIRSVGSNPTLVLSSDFPVAVGRDGALYYPELVPPTDWRILRVAPSGNRSVHATFAGPPRRDGSPSWINGLAAAGDGSLYLTQDRTVRRISDRGVVSTVAAAVTVPRCAAVPGIGPEMQPYLRGLDVAPDGAVIVAASGCGAVIRITGKGDVTPILRTASPYAPTAVAVSDGEVYVLEYLHTASDNRVEWVPRVRKIARDGAVTTLVERTR
jgi:hypothetical protein